MKKPFKGLIAVVAAFVILIGLTGCGEQKANNNDNENNNQQQEQQGGNNQQQEQGQKDNNTGINDNLAWPENELTKQVPKPDQKFTKEATGDDVAYYTYPNWTVDEARAYTEKLKSLGFVVSSTLSDNEEYYLIYLKSADGEYQVGISAEGSDGKLIISIPLDKRN